MGGGILNKGNLVLRDVVVRDNVAGFKGGGIHNSGTLTLEGNSRVTGNRARVAGGGIRTTGPGAVTLRDVSVITDNRARNGGGISNHRGRVILQDSSRVGGNTARLAGGGVINAGSLVLKGSSRISGNTALDGGGVAEGAIWDTAVTLYENSSIIDNDAGRLGGGLFVDCDGTAYVYGHSRISGNDAGEYGGGVDICLANRLTMREFGTIAENTAGVGGGGVAYDYLDSAMAPGVGCPEGTNLHGNSPDDCIDRPTMAVYATVILNDRSSISGNSAGYQGGGTHAGAGRMLNGVNCGANVSGNTPDDCHIE
jgi:hypothetical protein